MRELSQRPVGQIRQYPPRSQSRIRPKTLALSNRGVQHQSIDPDRETSAAE
jgi:hypothetical protein